MADSKFLNMKIKQVIVHQIYKRDELGNIKTPFFNSSCEKLSDTFCNKLKERIVKSLGKESHSIRMQVEDDGNESVFEYISNYWMGAMKEEDFINTSVSITKRLVEAQNSRRYPGGLVLCIQGTVQGDDKEFFCIVKAEKQDGFSTDQDTNKISLSYIDNVFMTTNERFQKLGMFIRNSKGSKEIRKDDVDVFLFDSNTSISPTKAKAEYFYKNFLGLMFRKDSDTMTLSFFEKTKEFISSRDDIENVKKIEISTALLDYVKAQGTHIINPLDFARINLPTASILDEYIKYLEIEEIDTNSIYKDTSLLGKILKYRQLTFENDVKMQIPVDEFSDIVEISKDDSGQTVVKIKGMMLGEK